MTTRTLIILGAAGDLTARLLLPGVADLLRPDVDAPAPLAVIGSGRHDNAEAFMSALDHALARPGVDPGAAAELRKRSQWCTADSTSADDLRRLLDLAAEVGQGPPALYLALPPAVSIETCRALRELELPEGLRLVMEKPFGTDLASARALNRDVAELVPESQVHRVDHFLGSDAVIGLLGLRFGNRIWEPVWNAEHVAGVDIVWDETLGLEGRAGYYDTAGALIDVTQSHLLQALALVAMDPPAELAEGPLRDEVQRVLQAVRTPTREQMAGRTARSRWTAGQLGDEAVPGYAESDGVDPDRGTETLAELELHLDLPRWQGVPFRLRTGKALGADRKQIVVTFKASPWLPGRFGGEQQPTQLIIDLDPADITVRMTVNGPGDPRTLTRVDLGGDIAPGRLSAYGEVLAGVFGGDPLLSVRGDSAEESWRIIDPVVTAWRADDVPLGEYEAGTQVPWTVGSPT